MTFNNWIDDFMAERGIDLDSTFWFINKSGFNFMDYGAVVAAIKTTNVSERAHIKNAIIKIDFANGDVLHFLRFLARGLAIAKKNGKTIENDRLLAKTAELKTRLKVAESTIMRQQAMLLEIADWLSVLPHEIEREAMQKKIRDDLPLPRQENLLTINGRI